MNGIKAQIAKYTTGIGLLIACYALLSSVVTFFGYEYRILMWINRWGVMAAWAIRAGLMVGGFAIAMFGAYLDPGNDPKEIERKEREREALWNTLRNHARVQSAAADISSRVPLTFDQPQDAQTYRVRQLLFQDPAGYWFDTATQRHFTPDDPNVTTVVFYLERQSEPQRRLVVAHSLPDRQISSQEAHPAIWAQLVEA